MSDTKHFPRLPDTSQGQDARPTLCGLKAGSLTPKPVLGEAHHFSHPATASRSKPQSGRSDCSHRGRMVTFKRAPQTVRTPASAMMTPKNAHDAPCAGLNAGIRRALDVSRLPESQFVNRQIAIHREFQSRQTAQQTISARLQAACKALETVAQENEWSQTKLASQVGVKESTFRKIKSGRADSNLWLPKLEAAVVRLIGSGNLPPEVVA